MVQFCRKRFVAFFKEGVETFGFARELFFFFGFHLVSSFIRLWVQISWQDEPFIQKEGMASASLDRIKVDGVGWE
jgi:hypothetical protein